MFNTFRQGKDWKETLANLKQYREEIGKYSAVPGLYPVLEQEYKDERERNWGVIVGGVVGEFKASLTGYQQAVKGLADARAKEQSRWDIVKLGAERTAIEDMVKAIGRNNSPLERRDKLEQLEQLYSELIADGSTLERKRAAVEVFSNVTEYALAGQTRHGQEVKYSLGGLAMQARSMEPYLRVTQQMIDADAKLQAAGDDLAAKQTALVEVGKTLGADVDGPFAGGNPLAKAYKQVRWNRDGSVAEIFSEDSPEVTGVSMGKLNLESVG